jgi:hypothetical protein
MMALMTLGLGLAVTYREKRWTAAPPLAGLALAAAVLTKFFALEAVLPALWMVGVYPSPPNPSAGGEGALSGPDMPAVGGFLAALVVPVGLELLLVSPAQQWDQVVTLHTRAAGLNLPNLLPPDQVLGQFLGLDAGLTGLAVAGLLALLMLRRWSHLIFLGLWVFGTLAMLYLFRPLFPHHPAVLLSGLAVSAGTGAGIAIGAVSARQWFVALPVAAAGVLYLALGARLAHDDRHVLIAGGNPAVSALATYVQAHTRPSQFIAADDLAVADQADRLVPPPLCDPSNVRLRAGYLTAPELIRATQHYQTVMVVPSFGIYWQVPGYEAWVMRHYRASRTPGGVLVWAR